ncbi:polysaccharide deacetylase family protein [Sporomusa sp. KB1]|jgi:peptidoglycan/xylan/chitin deacetylase (PgdA/CDA1 family)|uniref:polysaccharide deacetylase family protein n=1 Tax=Sporomusa sp. KB1 TaxID=943346 RepID=UPI00119E478A|nr:polysaccharide deacetylase family protein [Sporomusa sp. KB1]TWH45193.1 putative xylanase/chitin deacetylase [Sporomusa sp. KB1]
MIRSLQVIGAFILLVSLWLLAPGGGVPILAYHQVSSLPEIYSIDADEFDQQMQYLAENGYTAISLSELFAARQGGGKLPSQPVVITFDDGYEDNYLTALPIMEKHGMKGTVFVIAGQVGQTEYMTWEQLKALQQKGMEIGSHTFSHVALNEISPPEQLAELVRSKQVLETNLGQPVEFLAYPYGQYDSVTIAGVQQAGYTGACTGRPGLGTTSGDVYQLNRVNIPRPKYGLWEFRLRLLRAQIYGKLAPLW